MKKNECEKEKGRQVLDAVAQRTGGEEVEELLVLRHRDLQILRRTLLRRYETVNFPKLRVRVSFLVKIRAKSLRVCRIENRVGLEL